ncbi:uncharacterized protein [Polyergus mexicanus]|uniref:uncharacterized protein n=1 Tax=Polyergus mexicanus TaxID=615972 RepID=UPI0038B5AF99
MCLTFSRALIPAELIHALAKSDPVTMDRNMGKMLLPQGIRTPSDRRASPTVPEACPSLSHEGLFPLLPTGGEENLATVGTHSESDRDPLDLTFVGCSTSVELEDPENPKPVDAGIEAPVLRDTKANVKRKAKTSPETNSFSNGEGSQGGETPKRLTISLRKLRSRKKRPDTRAAGKSSSLEVPLTEEMSTESQERTDSDSNKARKMHKKSLDSKNRTNESSVILSSDDEEVGRDFAPQELRIMRANSVGAMGLDYLANIESMRSKSRNLQGGISGKMRKDIEKTKDVINTLIYKSEAAGDPSYLRLRNKELADQIDKLKLNEVLRNRETEELRSMVTDLKKEVTALRDKLDEVEEDRRKARESYRIVQRKLKKSGIDPNEDLEGKVKMIDKGTLTEEELNLPESNIAYDESSPVESPNVKILESGNVLEPEKKREILLINKQMKDLVRRKVKLKKGVRMNESETGGDSGQAKEKYLPQRMPRNRPRIISDIRLAPPSIPRSEFTRKITRDEEQKDRDITRISSGNEEWKTVNNKKKLKETRKIQDGVSLPSNYKTGNERSPNNVRDNRRPPKNAAVLITSRDAQLTYANVLKKAREGISLNKLDIKATKIRRAANGGLLIEVLDPDGVDKANALVDKLRDILHDQARVVRPTIKGEIRLIGLDDYPSMRLYA